MQIPLKKELIVKIANKIFVELTGNEPQKYQMDIILDDADRIIINKARGIGVSFAVACKIMLLAMTQKGEYIIVSQDKPNSEHILKYIYEFYSILKDIPIQFPTMKNAGVDMITFSNGSAIYSKPSEPKSLRGLHGYTFWDECAWHSNSYDLYKAINGCLRPAFPLIITSTPNEMHGIFYDKWTKADATRWKKIELPYTICDIPKYKDAVSEEKEDAIQSGLLDDFLQEYECKFVDGATRLFSWELLLSSIEKDKCTLPIEFGGMDFGKRVDQSIFQGVVKLNEVIRVPQTIEYALGMDYSIQIESITNHLKAFPNFCKLYIDSTGVGVKLIEDFSLSDIGYLTEGVTFTNSIKEKMAMFLYTSLQSGKLLLPNDKKLLKQFHSIKREKTQTGLSRYKHEDGKHDDSFWALALACMGYINDVKQNAEVDIKTNRESSFQKFKSKFKGDLWNS